MLLPTWYYDKSKSKSWSGLWLWSGSKSVTGYKIDSCTTKTIVKVTLNFDNYVEIE